MSRMGNFILVQTILLIVVISVQCFIIPRIRTFPVPLEDDIGKPLFLTQLIEWGMIERAQNLSKVKPDIGNTTSYSGYFTTNKKCGNNLFFWFFPAQEEWKSAPVVLWLEGGPGVSSMYSLFEALGPFNSFPDGLQTRSYSWNVKNNLLFIDQPVGTGYSFTEKKCFARNVTEVAEDLYPALVQFFKMFPDLQKNDFFLTGESYAGHYIPAIGYLIHKNNPSAQLKIILKGLMIGSAWVDPVNQINYADYLYQIGLIDSRQRQEFYYNQNLFWNQVNLQHWSGAYNTWKTIIHLIEDYSGVSIYNYIPQTVDSSNWDEFIQLRSTRKAIHVGSKRFRSNASFVHINLIEDMMRSVKPLVEFLLENNYRVVFYAGQLDLICGYPMISSFLQSLNWSGQRHYLSAVRSKWIEENGNIAGYIKGQHLLFDVLVRGAGHRAASAKPFWVFQLVNAFTMEQYSGMELFSYIHPR